jgi:hypothetical protein
VATWNIALFTKWSGVSRNDMTVAQSYPAEWTDLGQQTDGFIKNRSAAFCTMALGRVDDATLAAIQADTHYQILARYEDASSPSFDNRQSIITTGQRDAFVTYFSTEFGIAVGKIPVIQAAPGRTRQAVLIDIVQDLRALR